MCINIQYLFLWITSLCITGSSFIHFTIMDFNPFLFMAELYSTVYMYHSFFIHSSVNGYLGCFHVLVLQILLLWKLEYMCLWIMVFSGCVPSSGIAGAYGNFIPSFLRNFHTALHNGCINLHFHKECKKVPFSLQLLQHLSFIDFLMMPILTGIKWCLIVVFICISLTMIDVEHLFIFLLAICMSSLEKCLYRSFTHCLIRFFVFLILSCVSYLYILEINPFSFAIIFSHSEVCLFILFMASFDVQTFFTWWGWFTQ